MLSFRVPGTPSEVLADMLSDEGVCTRAGLHCAPLAHRSAGTLNTGTVRVSFSAFNAPGDCEGLYYALREAIKK